MARLCPPPHLPPPPRPAHFCDIAKLFFFFSFLFLIAVPVLCVLKAMWRDCRRRKKVMRERSAVESGAREGGSACHVGWEALTSCDCSSSHRCLDQFTCPVCLLSFVCLYCPPVASPHPCNGATAGDADLLSSKTIFRTAHGTNQGRTCPLPPWIYFLSSSQPTETEWSSYRFKWAHM